MWGAHRRTTKGPPPLRVTVAALGITGGNSSRGTPSYNEGPPTAPGQGGGGTPSYHEGPPPLRARTAGAHRRTTKAGTPLRVRVAGTWFRFIWEM